MKNLLFICSIIWLISCSDSHEDSITSVTDGLPVASLLEDSPRTFSLWTDLLKRADLYNAMKLDADYTAFVPTNDAVKQYLSQKSYSSIENIPVEEARLLVKYHTIQADKVYSQSQFESGVIPDTTASGDFLSIEFREGGLNAIYVNSVSRINQLDIVATNGVVHSLDQVLNPVTATVWDLVNTGKYSIFSDAIKLTKWDGLLAAVYAFMYNAELGHNITIRNYLTLFAVPDDVYKQNGINNVNELIQYLQVSGTDYEGPNNALNRYVQYHFIGKQTDYNELSSFSGETSKNIYPNLSNELINISIVNDNLYINYESENGISITQANVNAKNGIMHEVNGIMPIVTPSQVKVIWELTDESELAGLISEYRQSNLSSNTNIDIQSGTVSCYIWESIPLIKEKSLQYSVFNKNDMRYGLMNYDGLTLNLGLYGWVEMRSPAIIKGTYKVNIGYYSQNKATKDGKFTITLDGKYVGVELTANGASTTTAQLLKTNIGTVTFDETTSYVLRIIKTDDISVLLDYLEFEPVK